MAINFLGIDYGDKNVGLALAQDRGPALPYKVVKNNGRDDLLAELKKIIDSEAINIVVVGLPHSFSGKDNERLLITKQFVGYLQDNLDIEVMTADEQLTSKMFSKLGVKNDLDKYSASAILETFLANYGR